MTEHATWTLKACRERHREAAERDPLGFSPERLHDGELDAAAGRTTPWPEEIARQRAAFASGAGPANDPLAHLSKAERDRHELLKLLGEAQEIVWYALYNDAWKADAVERARALLAKLEDA